MRTLEALSISSETPSEQMQSALPQTQQIQSEIASNQTFVHLISIFPSIFPHFQTQKA
jgi:hypothetical protein